jgi:hypothetical protein
MTGPQIVAAVSGAVSVLTLFSTAINVYISLRLGALQAKWKADSAMLEVSTLKQFVTWKDELVATLNGKYVSDKLVAEMKAGLGREMTQIELRLDRIEARCEERLKNCPALRLRQGHQQPPTT